MGFFVGVDIGTTNVKAIVFDENWKDVFSVSASVTTHTAPNGICEQDALQIVADVDVLLAQCLEFGKKNKIILSAIGLSAAMHSFLAVDSELNPVSPLIIWSDTRAHNYSRSLKEKPLFRKFIATMNVPVHPMLPLVKWLWYSENGVVEAFKILSLKDFLIYRWFGECVTDVSTASATGYFDINNSVWNIELLQSLNLSPEKLPKVAPVTRIFTGWNKLYSSRFKNTALPPVVLGSTDGCLANLAAGILDNSTASLSIGTSGAVRTMTPGAIRSGTGLFCYPVFDDYFVCGGATNNGGNVLQWFQVGFGLEKNSFWQEFEEIIKTTETYPLLFVPYLFGERAPLWDPGVKGAYMGITNMHNKTHFLKASAEGVSFCLKHMLNKIMDEGNNIEKVVADGGFTKSEAWIQLVCDVLGVEMEIYNTPFGAARGAAMVAKMAVTDAPVTETANFNDSKRIFLPNGKRKDQYEILFEKYLKASDFMANHFAG